MLARCILCCFVCMLLLNSNLSTSQAQWIGDGTAVCTDTLAQRDPQITTDGAGGAIIAWRDGRNGNDDIFAQRIDADGYVLWTTDGVAICTAVEVQEYHQIVSDGSGGAIIAWRDYRGGAGSTDIYAQKISASGAVQWTADGVAICTANDYQVDPKLVSDGAGGAIITWRDDRAGSTNRKIYAQRVDTNGSIKWTPDGVPICTALSSHYAPNLAPDGSGGAIIAWQDGRFGGQSNIFAQKVDSLGNVQWTADGVGICLAAQSQRIPNLISDGSGGAIITWWDYRNTTDYDIYVQRVNSLGNVLWTADGVAVCTATRDQISPGITSDGSGGAIITWRDDRISGNTDIYAQRINSLGNVLWTPNGVAICNADESQWDPQLTTDGSSGAIIAWQDSRSSYWDVYAQRVDADSVVQWASDGAEISTAAGNQDKPQITSDRDGGAIITWQDDRSDADYDIYARRINDYLVPTLLRSYFVSYEDPAITITWTLSEIEAGMRFSILRKQLPQQTFRMIQNPVIEQSGLSFTCADRNCRPGNTYLYRVEVEDTESRRLLFETDPISVPVTSISLNQNYPNPFNPGTTITFTLPDRAQVNLSVYNMEGKLIRTLVNESIDGGLKEVTWDGKNNQGNPVGSGIYLYRLKAGNRILKRKMVHLK